jgi:glycerol kinase
MKKYLIIDSGSTVIKATVFSEDGNILVSLNKTIMPFYEGLKVEYDSKNLISIHLNLMEEAFDKAGGFDYIAIASQRSSFLFWDKESGLPLTPFISWQDGRAKDYVEKIEISNSEIHSITGLYKTPYYSALKMKYLIDLDKELKEKIFKGKCLFGPLPSYILWFLSDKKYFFIDPTLAQRTLLFNIKELNWDSKLLHYFDIPSSVLPEVRDSFISDVEFKFKGRDIKFLSMLGDQQAAVMPYLKDNTAITNYGTGAFILAKCGDRLLNIDGLLSSILYTDGRESQYMIEGTVNSCGTFLKWLDLKLGIGVKLDELDKIITKSSNDKILVLPSIGGIGSPYWDYDTLTTFTGFTAQTELSDLIKASLESIIFMLNESFELIGKKIEIKEIISSGGLSNISYLLQFQSDIMGVKVLKLSEFESTTLGLFYFVSLRMGSKLAMRLDVNSTYQPKINEEERNKKIERWKKFLHSTRKLYGK